MRDQENSAVAGPGFWEIATSKRVVRRASQVAIVVGVILAVINHGDRFLRGDIDISSALKILLTFCVPYSVSTYSSVLATRDHVNRTKPASGNAFG